jgi:hypothetical protein
MNGSPTQPTDEEVRRVIGENGGNVGVALVMLHWQTQQAIDDLKQHCDELQRRIAELEIRRRK